MTLNSFFKIILVPVCALLLGSLNLLAQSTTNLQPGDIVITGINAKTYDANGSIISDDEFVFVPLVDLNEGTVIYLTDIGWYRHNGAEGFITHNNNVDNQNGTTDGIVSYTVPPGGIKRGKKIHCKPQNLGQGFTMLKAGFSLQAGADQIIIYQGSFTSPQLIYGYNYYINWTSTGASSSLRTAYSALPAGLTPRSPFPSLGIAGSSAPTAPIMEYAHFCFKMAGPYDKLKSKNDWLKTIGNFPYTNLSSGAPNYSVANPDNSPVDLSDLADLSVEPVVLEKGEIAIVGYSSTSAFDLGFVYLPNNESKVLPEGTRINFTDNNWSEVTRKFSTNEGILTYTVPAGGLHARDVIIYSEQRNNFTKSGLFKLEDADQIFIYQGLLSGAMPIYALTYNMPWSFTDNAYPSELSVNSFSATIYQKDGVFQSCAGMAPPSSVAAIRALIAQNSNWKGLIGSSISLKMGLAECLAINNSTVDICPTFTEQNFAPNYPLVARTNPTGSVPVEIPQGNSSGYLPNYVRSYTFNKTKEELGTIDYSNWSSIEALATDKVHISTEYIDGLGNTVQKVAHNASSNGNDIIQAIDYDEFGRQIKEYLPYSISTNTEERYRPNALQEQYNFYTTNRPDNTIEYSQFAYSQKIFDNSPLNRVLGVAAPGESWVGSNKYKQTEEIVNIGNEVPIWNVSTTTDGSLQGISSQSYYPAGKLLIIKQTDESGNMVYEYKSLDGNILLRKQSKNTTGNEFLCTYYVYDMLNRLRVVIPPLAIEKFNNIAVLGNTNNTEPLNLDITLANNATLLSALYYYDYDTQANIIKKNIPSGGITRYVYDLAGRVILSQTALQAADNIWTCNKYDSFGRIVYFGNYTTTSSHAELIAGAKNFHGIGYEEKITTGYSQDNAFPNTSSNFELLHVSYFDDYIITDNKINTGNIPNPEVQSGEYENGNPFMLDNQYMVKGLVTASATKVLASNPEQWLWAVSYYDDKAQIKQTINLNARGYKDVTVNCHNFVGNLLRTKVIHNTSSANNTTQVVETKHNYDNFNRLVQIQQRFNNNPTWENISLITYGALGKLKTNTISNGYQQLDYEYNIRGWLTRVNDPFETTTTNNDLFSFELDYDRYFTNNRIDGNIAGTLWKMRKMDSKIRAFGFQYDGLGRLIAADYANNATVGSWLPQTSEDYSLKQVTYDNGGNITSLRQNGLIARSGNTLLCGEMDRINYIYDTNNPNQLKAVNDYIKTSGVSQDFRDDANGGNASYLGCSSGTPEYTYDNAGNLIQDKNKGIVLAYNTLNLPTQVNLANGATEYYTYDATGEKLQTKYVHNDTTNIRDYCNGWVYENDALVYTTHAEGRALRRASSNTWSYEYQLKDHLGSIRATFRFKSDAEEMEQQQRHIATMEVVNAEREDTTFNHIETSRQLDMGNAHTGSYSARLNAAEQRIIGPSKWMEVSAHDTIKAQAFAHYNRAPKKRLTDWLTLLPWVSAEPVINTLEGNKPSKYSPFLQLGVAIPLTQELFNKKHPKAYLRYAFFNKDSVFVSGGVRQVSQAAIEGWEPLNLGFVAKEDGYVQVWVGNESTADVFFDDIETEVLGKYVVEYLNYNPWGLELEGLTYSSSPYRYNGKEAEKSTKFLDYGARRYDKQIGRWWSVDPMAEKYNSLSSYNYCLNNPIKYIDPDGRDIWIHSGDNQRVKFNNGKLYNDDGSQYKGKDSFVSTVSKYLGMMGKTEIGNSVLSSLSSSKNSFNFVNQKPESGGSAQFVANSNTRSNGGKIIAGNLSGGRNDDISKLSIVSHELFHAYQNENKEFGPSINNEVGGYLFGAGVVADYNYGINSGGFGKNTPAGNTYQDAMYSMLYVGFDAKNYKIAIESFKEGSAANVKTLKRPNGLYNDFPKKPILTNPVIRKFSPYIR